MQRPLLTPLCNNSKSSQFQLYFHILKMILHLLHYALCYTPALSDKESQLTLLLRQLLSLFFSFFLLLFLISLIYKINNEYRIILTGRDKRNHMFNIYISNICYSMYSCILTHTYQHIYTNINKHTCIYIHTYTFVHTSTYICTIPPVKEKRKKQQQAQQGQLSEVNYCYSSYCLLS